MPRFICLSIVKASAVVVCLGIASSACFFRGHDAHDGGEHREDHHDDDHHGEEHHGEHR